ncbi:unnamed protein product [Prorocentrum cordatum]|uniref:Uncharacterized protein n=1 Tax=Prorocentrum cordatum TaxID=2364126 RepID=A0ABN9PFI3_9DINO|nr:unnamed protein product [Polarella glacialis]
MAPGLSAAALLTCVALAIVSEAAPVPKGPPKSRPKGAAVPAEEAAPVPEGPPKHLLTDAMAPAEEAVPEPPPVDVQESAAADAAEAAKLEEEAEAAAADEAAEAISLPAGVPLALPSVFASHMVVPAGVQFTMWGLAQQGTGPVSVTMNRVSVSAELEADGRWTVTLPAMEVSSSPTAITIASATSNIELEDVLVGDVYVCMGGDNMGMPLNASRHSGKALQTAEKMGDNLRIMSVQQVACCAIPQDNFTARTPWRRTWSEEGTEGFSALCYHFGVEQITRRPDQPVGLIQVTAAGSQSWQWAPSHTAQTCERPGDVAADTVSIYWNSMLRPLVPLKGVRAFLFELSGDGCVSIDMVYHMQEIWRADRPGDPENAVPAIIGAQYSCTSPAELTRADYDYQEAFLQLPRSGFAVTSDLCSVTARGCGSHSPFKQEEAQRFATRAEALLWKKDGVPANAPKPVHVFVDRYEPSWGKFHYGVVGDFTCHTCVWGMRIVFDQDVELRPEFADFKGGFNGHINGFQLYVNTKPGLNYFPVTMQLNWVGGNTVQLNATIKVGALGVDSPWPGRLQYGEGPFPVMPLVSGATGEPVPQLSIEVPLGDGKAELRKLY